MTQRIYLDNNATTALDPSVFKAMLQDLSGPPANPSSMHWFGQRARTLLATARQTVASFLQARPEEIIFTSGGTESINLMLRGLGHKGHLITTAIEHSAMHRTVQSLEKQGLSVTYVPVGFWGAPLPEDLKNAIQSHTIAIALSAANTETGVQIDLDAIASLAQAYNIPLLIDGVAYIGKEPFRNHPGISALALSGHKFHGPKGSGVLYRNSSLKLSPVFTGGFQEYQLRPGTENLSAILGLAAAIQILQEQQDTITQHLLDLRLRFENALKRALPNIVVNGEGPRISNISNLSFTGMDGETLLMQLDLAGVAASHGSACSSGSLEPSRVLAQMGFDKKRIKSSMRFSFSRFNTREEIDHSVSILTHLAKKQEFRD